MKPETYGIIWHVVLESKIQLVNCKLSPKYLIGLLSLSDINAIDAYIFWSLLLSPLLDYFCDARLTLSPKRTCFLRFSFSLGGFGNLESSWSSDPCLKHLWVVRSVRLLSESPAAWYFSSSFMIILRHFSAEWLAPPQNVHFVWTIFSLTLFLPQPELLSIFR